MWTWEIKYLDEKGDLKSDKSPTLFYSVEACIANMVHRQQIIIRYGYKLTEQNLIWKEVRNVDMGNTFH